MKENWVKVFNLPQKKCFGCGQANDIGLKLEFISNGTIVKTSTYIPERLAGWANLTHGGITATIIDETLAWTVIYLKRKFILTKNISVNYLRPIFIGDQIVCEGSILEERFGKDIFCQARIFNQSGELVAQGEGLIATYDGLGIRKFGFLDEEFLIEFEDKVLNQ